MQAGHSKKKRHASVGIDTACRAPQCGHATMAIVSAVRADVTVAMLRMSRIIVLARAAAIVTTAPAIAKLVPTRSAVVGRWPSTAHSHSRDAAM